MSLDIKTYEFPEVDDVQFAFPTFNTIPKLLAEAKERGFYCGNTKWNKAFDRMFFGGDGETPVLKKDANMRSLRYCGALMRSFSPKHEEKEAVCALIMSENLLLEE